MKIVLVQGGASGCEPKCPEWISAEGQITKETPAVFSALLKTLGKRRPPILIHSTGGNIDAATRIGALIRKHGFDVAVGRTQFLGCNPTESCAETDSKKGFRGSVTTSRVSYCASACVLVLAAGKQRILLPRAVVGVHQIRVNRPEQIVRRYRIYYRTVNERRKEVRREYISSTKVSAKQFSPEQDGPIYGKLKTYVRRMGVEPALIDMFQRAEQASMHWLFDPDLTATRLITARRMPGELFEASAPGTSPAWASSATFQNPWTAREQDRIASGELRLGTYQGKSLRLALRALMDHSSQLADIEIAVFTGTERFFAPKMTALLDLGSDGSFLAIRKGVWPPQAPLKANMSVGALCRLLRSRKIIAELEFQSGAKPVTLTQTSNDFLLSSGPQVTVCAWVPEASAATASAVPNRFEPVAPLRPVTLLTTQVEVGNIDGRITTLALEIGFDRSDRLVVMTLDVFAGSIRLQSKPISVLLEMSNERAFVATRDQRAPPGQAMQFSMTTADFCNLIRGEPMDISLEGPLGMSEAVKSLRTTVPGKTFASESALKFCAWGNGDLLPE